MKKGLSVIKYILLSLVLFFGGVMIEVSPTDFVKAVTQDVKDLTPEQMIKIKKKNRKKIT